MLLIGQPLGLIRDEPGVPAGGDGQEEEAKDHGEQNLHQPSDVLKKKIVHVKVISSRIVSKKRWPLGTEVTFTLLDRRHGFHSRHSR